MKDSDILCVYDYCDHACGPRSSMWVDMLGVYDLSPEFVL